MKNSNPSLVDVILTNKPKLFMISDQCDIGLSDWYNMVYTVLKRNHTPFPRTKMNYRCFKNLDTDGPLQDLQRIPFHVPHVFDDINEAYWAREELTKEVLDEHIPVKQKHKRKNSAPFMSSELRRAINHKKSLWRKFQKVTSSPKGNDAHLRATIQSQKNGEINF